MARLRHDGPYDSPETDVLVLNYTMACPLKCDFCCYGCHPSRSEKMELSKARDLISQAAEMPEFSSVGFTGGEVFMHLDELMELATHLKSVQLPFTVATAGHWASDSHRTEEIVAALVDRGLKRMNVSHDHAHAEYVSARCVENAAVAAAAHAIPVYIVGTFSDPQTRIEDLLPAIRLDERIRFFTKRVSRVGRATKQEIYYGDFDPSERPDSCYRRQYHDIVVFHDGAAYPCCSTFNRATPGIKLGNVYEDSLRSIRERAEASLRLRTMKARGFRQLYEIVRRFDPELFAELPDPAASAGACSLCSSLFKSDRMTSRINAVFQAYEDDLLRTSIAWLQSNTEKENVADLLGSITGDRHRRA